MTVYWMVWDAAAQWVVDRLDREGALAAVRRLRSRGWTAAARPPRPNCQTPPSLATLFTGTWPRRHGVAGFTVPRSDGTVTEEISGFAPGFPLVRPVWETLGRQGVRSAFVHTPWVFDAADEVGAYVEAAIEAYSRRLARHQTFTVTAGERSHWPIAGHDVEVMGRPDGVEVTTAADRRVLTPEDGWATVRIDPGVAGYGTWIRCLPERGQWLLVHTGVWEVRAAGDNAALVDELRTGPVFAGEGVGRLYRAGRFGPRLVDGGDGTAEEILLSSLECAAQSFGAATDAVLAGHDADLVVCYLPITDDIGHELLGWCDAESAAHRPEFAEAIWGYLRRCYQWADEILGRVLDKAGPDDTVILSADHGMAGSTHLVHLNDQLARFGLVGRASDGRLDPAQSAVVYHPANNGSLWVNPRGRPSGVVPASETASAMRSAMAALRTITDPETGRPVVAGFVDENGEPLPPEAGPTVAYVVLADDYQPSAVLNGDGPVVRPTAKSGAHVVNTGSSRLHATFAAAGPGIPEATHLGVVDNTLPAALVLQRFGLAGLADDPVLRKLPI